MESTIKPALCSQCGAKLLVDAEKEAAICEFCGTPFIVEKAIQNFNISSYGSINIANAVINQGPSASNYVKRARQFEKENNADKALEYYNKALDLDADCEEAILGLIELRTNNVLKESEELVHNKKTLQAIECLKKEILNGLNTPRIVAEIQRLESVLENTVYFCDEAWYKWTALQFVASKGKITMTGKKLIFDDQNQIYEINVPHILEFEAVENMNYVGEALGRKKENCLRIRYMDQISSKTKKVDFRIHCATETARILNSILSDIRVRRT